MANLSSTHTIDRLTTPISRRIIRLKQVIEMTGLSRSTIYDRMNPKSSRYDESFPKSIKLGSKNLQTGAIGWEEAQVQQWIAERTQVCTG